ncbi:MAG: hypothetical protein C6Y22_25975 [Hapalosiphonaceae cyanobacterium JJU2]|nr:MAG: hypothetical protein C6Y22_25975 [Hapalosiphonaceae cyanobacterium JJU2]
MALEPATSEVAIAEQIKQFLIALSISLSVATLPQIFSWFRRIPYTLLLVIVGLGLAFLDVRLVNLSPGLILTIFLPPLLFEAAWNLKWSNLKQDFLPICLYAVVGVIISIAGIALGLNQFAGLDLSIALLVGASLSATDPVSVTALFRELGASKRLTTLMEGESLFNVAIYSLSSLSDWLAKSKIPLSEQTVLWWGGLRGSVSIALALSVPMILPQRDEIIATVFGVVLFTLLVQGLTIQPLLEKLQLLGSQPLRQQYMEAIARQVALQRALEYLETTQKRPGIQPEFYYYQKTLLSGEITLLQEKIDKLLDEYPNLQEFTTEQLKGELLAIEADTYAEFVRAGRLNKELSPFLQIMDDKADEES